MIEFFNVLRKIILDSLNQAQYAEYMKNTTEQIILIDDEDNNRRWLLTETDGVWKTETEQPRQVTVLAKYCDIAPEDNMRYTLEQIARLASVRRAVHQTASLCYPASHQGMTWTDDPAHTALLDAYRSKCTSDVALLEALDSYVEACRDSGHQSVGGGLWNELSLLLGGIL